MNAVIVPVVVFLLMGVAMAGQWLWLHRSHRQQLDAVREKHVRYKARAEELLTSTKLQIASLKHQLTGARLEAARSERPFPKTIIQSPVPKSTARDSLLMMLDDVVGA